MAKATVAGHDLYRDQFVVRTDRGWFIAGHVFSLCADAQVTDVHPLAVLDVTPAQAREIARHLHVMGGGPPGSQEVIRQLADFADEHDPQVAEPLGLGAVVEECRTGKRYVRTDSRPAYPWVDVTGGTYDWANLRQSVRVLSEGVQ